MCSTAGGTWDISDLAGEWEELKIAHPSPGDVAHRELFVGRDTPP